MYQFLSMIFAFGVATAVLSGVYIGVRTDFSDAAAMGATTSTVFQKVGSFPIHCQGSEDFQSCVHGLEARRANQWVLWLGNSQLHAVNQLQPEQENAPPMLFRRLRLRNMDMFAFSQGNANLQEHYLAFESARKYIGLRILILPLVFDDLREDGIRDDLLPFADDARTASALQTTRTGRRILELRSRAQRGSSLPQTELSRTPQEVIEAYLEQTLSDWFSLWAVRPEIRGDIFIGLYKLRNTVFGITPSTKRGLIRGRYAGNMRALDDLLQTATKSGISVLAYIAPVGRFRGEAPYEESEYRQFKDEVALLAGKYGVIFVNLENLVPDEFWGRKDGTSVSAKAEMDFMHFTAPGHALLTEAIDRQLLQLSRPEGSAR
jgi:hypothetical protein